MSKNKIKGAFYAQTSLLAAVVSLAALGCGKPKVKSFNEEKFAVPSFDPKTSFLLIDDQEEHSFNGSLLIWDPKLESDKVSNLLQSTKDYNTAYAEYVKFYRDTIVPKATEILGAFAKNDADQAAVAQQENEQLRTFFTRAEILEQGKTKLWNWVQDKIASEIPGDTDAAKLARAEGQGVLARYCEAKLLEFGSDAAVAKYNFTQRPTPSAMCETWYQTMGLFQIDECKVAESAEGKNYFSCFWKGGIAALKPYDIQGTTWKLTPFWENFKTKPALEGPDFERMQAAIASKEQCNAQPLRTSIFNGQNCVFADGKSFDFSLLQNLPPKTLANLKVGLAVTMLDSFGTLGNPILFKSGSLFRETSGYEKSKAFSDKLGKFTVRSAKSDPLNDLEVSLHDVLFNGPLRVPAMQRSLDPHAELDAELASVFPVASVEASLIAEKEKLATERQNLAASAKDLFKPMEENCDVSLQSNLCRRQEGPLAKLSAAREPGVAKMLAGGFNLTLRRAEDGSVRVSIHMDPSAKPGGLPFQRGLGCLDSFESGKSVECQGVKAGQLVAEPNGTFPLVVTFDRETSKLQVKWDVKAPIQQGFLEPGKEDASGITSKDAYFNRIELATIQDSEIEAELYLNSMFDLVPFYSGKVFVRKGGNVMFQGVASYLFDYSLENKMLEGPVAKLKSHLTQDN
jgi:hypothetical protein